MKRKGLLIVLLIALLAGGGLYYAYQNLGNIVQSVLKDELPGLKFKELDVGLTQVTATDIEYAPRGDKGRLKTKRITIDPSLSSLLSDTLQVNDIIIEQPELDARKLAKGGGLRLPVPEGKRSGTEQAESETGKTTSRTEKREESKRKQTIHIKSARLSNGKVNFIDESVAGTPARIVLSDVNFSANDVFIPARPGPMPLDLALKVPAKRTGTISLKGTVDRVARSGELGLQVSSLFLPVLAPYYQGPEVDLQLSDGRISADVKVGMTDGKYKVTGFVELAELKIERGRFHGFSAEQIQEYFKQRPGPIKVDLALEGDLDKPGSMRRSVLRTIVQVLVEHLGHGRLEGAKQKLQQGDVEGAKQELKQLKRELKELFKRK